MAVMWRMPALQQAFLESALAARPCTAWPTACLQGAITHLAHGYTTSACQCSSSQATDPSAPSTSSPASSDLPAHRGARRATKRRVLQQPLDAKPSPFIAQLLGSHQQEEGAADSLQRTDALVLRRHSSQGSLYHKLSDGLVDLITLLRRHNTSLPSLPGQVVLAQVLHLTPEHAYVDTGFHSLSEVPRADLRVQHVQRPHASAPLAQRRGTSDVRCGDVVRLKVDALYTPYGDMQLEPAQQDARLQRHALWAALAEVARRGQPVKGRVLNACRGGYAVGVAGFVGLLPYARASAATCQRLGVLQEFFVERVDATRQTFVVSDARVPAGRRGAARGGRAA